MINVAKGPPQAAPPLYCAGFEPHDLALNFPCSLSKLSSVPALRSVQQSLCQRQEEMSSLFQPLGLGLPLCSPTFSLALAQKMKLFPRSQHSRGVFQAESVAVALTHCLSLTCIQAHMMQWCWTLTA